MNRALYPNSFKRQRNSFPSLAFLKKPSECVRWKSAASPSASSNILVKRASDTFLEGLASIAGGYRLASPSARLRANSVTCFDENSEITGMLLLKHYRDPWVRKRIGNSPVL